MKKVILVLLMFISTVGFTQNNNNNENKSQSFEEMLVPYVKDLLDFAKEGAGFIVEETPEVIKQYIMYEAVTHWLLVLLGVFLLIGLPLILRRILTVSEHLKDEREYYKKISKKRWIRTSSIEVSFEQVVYYAGSFISIVVGTSIFFTHISTAIQATFFPKLFLLQTFMNLVS